MTFKQEIERAIDTLIDLCSFHEGNCEECEGKDFCNSEKPMELA